MKSSHLSIVPQDSRRKDVRPLIINSEQAHEITVALVREGRDPARYIAERTMCTGQRLTVLGNVISVSY